MTYTTTEERRFSTMKTSAKDPAEAVAAAMDDVVRQAKLAGFAGHVVKETFEIRVFINAGDRFQADAAATYARIVNAAQLEETDPAEDEYAEHDRRKAAELGMSTEEYARGVEDR